MIKNTKIEVYSIDDKGEDSDNCYCAICLIYDDSSLISSGDVGGWYNSGIVVRETDPVIAFVKAMNWAKEKNLWK